MANNLRWPTHDERNRRTLAYVSAGRWLRIGISARCVATAAFHFVRHWNRDARGCQHIARRIERGEFEDGVIVDIEAVVIRRNRNPECAEAVVRAVERHASLQGRDARI